MSMSFFWVFVSLPMMILQWVGVVVLARAGRRADWWCMLAGVILSSLSPIFNMLVSLTGFASKPVLGYFSLVSIVGITGSLLFMIGFCLHALRTARMVERSAELEAIASAQAEQLNRG